MVRAIPTRMLYTLIIHLWIPPCDSSNGLRNLYYYITGRFFTSRALGNASACPSPPAPLGDLYQIVINWERYIENRKSSVRCKVEHAFWIIKCQFGYKKTVYRGLKKNENRLYAMFACANLYALAIAGRKLATT